jgi:hypothetical protein
MGDHDPQSNLFFMKPKEDLARAHDFRLAIRSALSEIQGGLESELAVAKIHKSNTRFSSQYLVDFLDKDESTKRIDPQEANHRSDAEF